MALIKSDRIEKAWEKHSERYGSCNILTRFLLRVIHRDSTFLRNVSYNAIRLKNGFPEWKEAGLLAEAV